MGISSYTARAQESLNTSGKDLVNASGSVNYSIGQVFYSQISGAGNLVSQGVQQPYEISVVTAIESTYEIHLSFKLYPNPTTDFLNLSIGNYKPGNLFYQLYDVNQKLIAEEKISAENEVIPMSAYASGIYFIKVAEKSHELKTFKIIKN